MTNATYPTLMLHLDMAPSHQALLNVAANLAHRFKSGVIGITAAQPMDVSGDAYGSGDLIQQDREDIDRCMTATESEFRQAMHNRVAHTDWRAIVTSLPLANSIAHEARSADLIITGDGPGPNPQGNRQVDLGSLILHAGRPILIVPPTPPPPPCNAS